MILDRKTLDEVYEVHAILNWHITLPETMKMGRALKRKRSSSNHPFSGVNSLLVSGSTTCPTKDFMGTWHMVRALGVDDIPPVSGSPQNLASMLSLHISMYTWQVLCVSFWGHFFFGGVSCEIKVLGCFRERTYMLTMNPHITNWVPIAVP